MSQAECLDFPSHAKDVGPFLSCYIRRISDKAHAYKLKVCRLIPACTHTRIRHALRYQLHSRDQLPPRNDDCSEPCVGLRNSATRKREDKACRLRPDSSHRCYYYCHHVKAHKHKHNNTSERQGNTPTQHHANILEGIEGSAGTVKASGPDTALPASPP